MRAAAAREAAPLLAVHPERNANLQIASRALAPFALRGVRKGLRKVRGRKRRKGGRKGVPAKLWKRMN